MICYANQLFAWLCQSAFLGLIQPWLSAKDSTSVTCPQDWFAELDATRAALSLFGERGAFPQLRAIDGPSRSSGHAEIVPLWSGTALNPCCGAAPALLPHPHGPYEAATVPPAPLEEVLLWHLVTARAPRGAATAEAHQEEGQGKGPVSGALPISGFGLQRFSLPPVETCVCVLCVP